MRKEELIELAKELSTMEDLSSRRADIILLKREAKKFNERDDDTFHDQELAEEFSKYYSLIAEKETSLNASSYDDKKALIEKAKELLTRENVNGLRKDFNNIFNEFKTAGRCSKEQDDELWNEIKNIGNEINKRVQAHYEEQKVAFEASKAKKESLIEEAKKVLEIDNIKEGQHKLDSILEEWKKAGYSGKENDDYLWNSFKEVRSAFNEKRRNYYANLDKVFEERAAKKEEIIKQVKKITIDAYFTTEEIKQIKDIQNEFRKIGFAGKEKDDQLYEEFNAAINQYFKEMKFYK